MTSKSQYTPLSDYGIVGNLKTSCLVSRHGSIDWCAFPDVDSPSVFAAILDAERGGHFHVRPPQPYQSAQSYVDRTNVLTTEFFTPTGRVQLVDWMPLPQVEHNGGPANVIYRKATCTSGSMELTVEFEPRFNYGREVPEIAATADGVIARGGHTTVTLSGPTPFETAGGGAESTISLDEGETAWVVLRYGHDEPYDPAQFQRRLERTVDGWRQWLESGRHLSEEMGDGRWQSLVDRSALALKLLIHDETGAITAAPTTSLPEEIGGSRNWDYRYTWIRDAALTVQALYKLGYVEEVRAYFSWLLDRVYEDPTSIRPLYDLHGSVHVPEETLDHLEGYRGSAPVRMGNAASEQLQLDIYGELILAIYETTRFGEILTESNWTAIRQIVEYVAEVWDRPDEGIWEVRSEPQHFVHSKVMSWAALDRGVKFVEEGTFDGPVEAWRQTRSAIREAILDRGYSEELGSFVRSFDNDDTVDATALLIPTVGFLPVDDPRVQGTIDVVMDRLMTEEGMVYRYDGGDGLPGGEGTFVLCSFWLVNALALSGRIEEAEGLFETLLSHTSPLGLLSEEIETDTKELIGNYPQAFSHIGLIDSALYLDRARREARTEPVPVGSETERQGENRLPNPT
ncbi:MAG: glycoside hydrolase family 15 protein [Halodesulfurarchaeum sp.]